MQASADALTRAVSGSGQTARGTVRITASQIVAAFVLPPLLAKLAQEAPEVQIEVVTSNEVKNLLRREGGHCDSHGATVTGQPRRAQAGQKSPSAPLPIATTSNATAPLPRPTSCCSTA